MFMFESFAIKTLTFFKFLARNINIYFLCFDLSFYTHGLTFDTPSTSSQFEKHELAIIHKI